MTSQRYIETYYYIITLCKFDIANVERDLRDTGGKYASTQIRYT